MKTKITLLTVVATVALAGAAFSAKAQFISVHAWVPVPRIYVPAPRVWCPPVVHVNCYGAPVYEQRACEQRDYEQRDCEQRDCEQEDCDRDNCQQQGCEHPSCEHPACGTQGYGDDAYPAPVYHERVVTRYEPVYVHRVYYGYRRW